MGRFRFVFYPSELQAAFLLAQLESIENNLEKRRTLTEVYDKRLIQLEKSGLVLRQQRRHETSTWNHHAMIVVFASAELTEKVRKQMLHQKIHAYIGYVPSHSSTMVDSLP